MNEQRLDIKRSLRLDGSLAPCALNYLEELPANYTYLHDHARRHPLGIYNLSLDQLEKNFSKVFFNYSRCLKLLKSNIQIDGGLAQDNLNEEYLDLLQSQQNLIYSLRSHIDDCYAVLASLINPAAVSPKANKIVFTEKWLEAVKFPSLKSFNRQIAFFKNDWIGPLVNGLKHRQCRLRGLFFYRYYDIRLGYYLEDSHTDGVPGPSALVHKDRNSAFSFARDIRLNLFYVYRTSEALVDTLKTALRTMHSYELKPNNNSARNEKWTALFEQLEMMPLRVFPDEMEKSVATVTYGQLPGNEFVELSYPWLLWSPPFPTGMKIKSSFELDGVGKTYKLPYLAPSKYGRVR